MKATAMSMPKLRATFAAALVPLAALAAADRTDDVRFGVGLGVAGDSTFSVEGGGSAKQEVDADGQPVRLDAGLVHRFAGPAASGAIIGFELLYQDERFHLDGTISGIRRHLHARAFGVDLLAGYALVLPSQPRLRIEAAVTGGYFIEQMQLNSGDSDIPFAGDGWDAGATVGLIWHRDDGWEVGAQVRWLALFDGAADYGHGNAKLETDGFLVGLTLGHRL